MFGFILWTAAYAAAGLEVVRIFSRMQEQDEAAFEPEPVEDSTGQVRRLRATRPGHIDLAETDLRR